MVRRTSGILPFRMVTWRSTCRIRMMHIHDRQRNSFACDKLSVQMFHDVRHVHIHASFVPPFHPHLFSLFSLSHSHSLPLPLSFSLSLSHTHTHTHTNCPSRPIIFQPTFNLLHTRIFTCNRSLENEQKHGASSEPKAHPLQHCVPSGGKSS